MPKITIVTFLLTHVNYSLTHMNKRKKERGGKGERQREHIPCYHADPTGIRNQDSFKIRFLFQKCHLSTARYKEG